MTTTPQPGEVIRRSKQIEYGPGPKGQPVVIAISEAEWLDGVTPDPPEYLELSAAATERRVAAAATAAVQRTSAAIAQQAVQSAAPKITLAVIQAFLQALPEPADDISGIDYVRALRMSDVRIDAGKVHVYLARSSQI